MSAFVVDVKSAVASARGVVEDSVAVEFDAYLMEWKDIAVTWFWQRRRTSPGGIEFSLATNRALIDVEVLGDGRLVAAIVPFAKARYMVAQEYQGGVNVQVFCLNDQKATVQYFADSGTAVTNLRVYARRLQALIEAIS